MSSNGVLPIPHSVATPKRMRVNGLRHLQPLSIVPSFIMGMDKAQNKLGIPNVQLSSTDQSKARPAYPLEWAYGTNA